MHILRIVCALSLFVAGSAFAQSASTWAEKIRTCYTAADAGVAYRLWEKPIVRKYFRTSDPERQHDMVNEICYLAEHNRRNPGVGGDIDFFTFVEESSIGKLLYDATSKEKGASRLGTYVALHELSHGRTP